MKNSVLSLAFAALFVPNLWAQNGLKPTNKELPKEEKPLASPTASESNAPPKLFINCTAWQCYEDFVRTELNFFDFVRDRFEADIQVLIINQDNAAGGAQYTLDFIGQGKLAGKTEKMIFTTKQADTDEIIRQRLLQFLKLGLVKFELPTELLENVSVSFKKRETAKAMVKNDRWNYWVFQLGANGNINGGSNRFSLWTNNYVSARRITNHSKWLLNASYTQNTQEYTIDDETYRAKTENTNASVLHVKSLGEHWSAGGGYVLSRSVYQNYHLMQQVSPALEYNAFPYSENTKHQLRFLYQAGVRSQKYIETTIFDKSHELLPFQRFDVGLNLTRTWGTVGVSGTAFQYLHDASKYRLSLGTDISWRVFEGFSFNMSGNISYVKDQVYLPASAFDPTAVLLGARQLPTNFDYWAYFGISYTFGSINNSVVNPRFNDF